MVFLNRLAQDFPDSPIFIYALSVVPSLVSDLGALTGAACFQYHTYVCASLSPQATRSIIIFHNNLLSFILLIWNKREVISSLCGCCLLVLIILSLFFKVRSLEQLNYLSA